MWLLDLIKDLATRFAGACWGGSRWVATHIWRAVAWILTWIWTQIKAVATAALVVAFLGLVVASYNAFFNPPNSWVRKHIWPRVDLEANPRELMIDDQATLEVKVNTLSAKDQFHCRWTISPTRPGDTFLGGITQDNCDPVPLRNFATTFQVGEQERTIGVGVAVSSAEGKNVGHDSISLKLLNRTGRAIRITPDTVRLNETVQIDADFGPLRVGQTRSPVTPPYRCTWVIRGNTVNDDNCSIRYKAQARVDSPAKEIVDVRLAIHDAAGNVVGGAQQSFSVVWPTGDFYVYAIETTERMNSKARGVTLASSVADLAKQIQTKSSTTASIGIKKFGRADPPGDRSKCGAIDTVYEVKPFDAERIAKVVEGIKVDGYLAPVLQAAAESLDELTKHAQHNVWLYLVMITGGPDGCTTGSEQDTLNRIAAALQSSTVQVAPVEVQVLGLTLRLASPEEAPLLIEGIWNSVPARGEIPYFQLVVTNESVLNQALEAVAGLANADVGERRASCNRLAALLRQTADLTPNLRERRNPQAVQIEAWCRRSRI